MGAGARDAPPGFLAVRMVWKRHPAVDPGDVVNVSAARADFRKGRFAPVNVGDVCRGLRESRGERAMIAVSQRQHRLILTRQLEELGLGRSGAAGRARAGTLTRVHRGVYLVAALEPTITGSMLASVLAAGDGALLSGRAALQLWGASPAAHLATYQVLAPTQRRSRAGIDVHRSTSLAAPDLCAISEIPLTAPARSLLDFAVEADPGELETALNELRAARLLKPRDLEELRSRTRGHHGWGALNRLLEAEREPDFSRREAEQRLLALVREAHLPEPRRNVRLHGYEVDLNWPDRRLVVEVDSWAFHGDRRSFESDRRKQAELADHGLEVQRFTWRQIANERVWTIARIAGRLGARGPAPI